MRLILPKKRDGDKQDIVGVLNKVRYSRVVICLFAFRFLIDGFSQVQVAVFSNVRRDTVWDWVSKWFRAGKVDLISIHKGSVSKVTPNIMAEISVVIDFKREINGRTVTGRLIHGYLK